MSILPNDPLELAILLFKNTQDRAIDDGKLRGKLSEDLNFDTVKQALENKEFLLNANKATRTLEWHLPPSFFQSLEHLLDSPARRIKSPKRFYLADSDTLYTGNETDLLPNARQYLAATRLFALLSKVADHHGGVGDSKTLVFLQQSKIEITPQYSSTELTELKNLAAFESEFIASQAHQEQKKSIIKTVLFEQFSGANRLPFGTVLQRFDDFFEKVQASYDLYVAEFSFQKVKTEIEKEKLDAMIKLNKVFSDVQSQLLTVPVALVLVGGQLEDKGAWSNKNLLIWLGALVFAVLMDLLIRNQRHTLTAVKQEIDQQRQQLEKKYNSVANRFLGSYSEIDHRYIHQRRLIWVIDFLVAMSLGATTYMFIWFSGSLRF
ncbi:hypothetical protein ACH50O_19400 [Methylomonas sp. 2BW1-5-20]|uniref:hypothetical protein n=1 Tax=Methylomonas sp. 2BW1-5-20 TaxID=3376686 RepID=UPI004051463F